MIPIRTIRAVTPNKKHQHLIVYAEISKPPSEEDCDFVREWLSDLITSIGMNELAPPRARYCNVPGNRGLTADAIIETSHVVCHTWDEGQGILEFDLYTCSDLCVEEVLSALIAFEPTRIEWKFLDRYNGLTLVDQSSWLEAGAHRARQIFAKVAHFWSTR